MLANLQHLRFASDATELALWGAVFLFLAVVAWVGDRRRAKRKDINAVGWMPWTGLFFVSLLLGVTLTTLGVSGWMTPG